MKKRMFAAVLILAVLCVSFAGCLESGGSSSGARASSAAASQTASDSGDETLNYTVTEGYSADDTVAEKHIKTRLPKVVHTKNAEIGVFYDSKIENERTWIGDLKSGKRQIEEGELLSHMEGLITDYEVREGKGLVSVNVVADDFVSGLTFDNDGKIYSDDEIFAIYNTTRAAVVKALEPDMPEDDVMPADMEHLCHVYSDDTIICMSYGGGDFFHGALVTVKDGKLTVIPLYEA